MRRRLFSFIAIFVVTVRSISYSGELQTTWSVLKIGAGGFITGIDIARDGTKIVRTDTYGAWFYSHITNSWQQCVTMNSMPDGTKGLLHNKGVYEIAIAPNNANRLYMLFNGDVFRSDNDCTTWTLTHFPQDTADFSGATPENDPFRTFGRKMAIDPANEDILYVGTPSQGVFVTNDGGNSWKAISQSLVARSLKTGGYYPGYAISFDENSVVSNGRTQGIYIASYGNGVYHSTNGGAAWAVTKNAPKTFQHMIVDRTGTVWLCDDVGNGRLHKFTDHWSLILNAGNNCHSIAVNPSNARTIYVGANNGSLVRSNNRGRTWVGPIRANLSASDIPWLAWANDSWLSNGDMKFDPSQTNLMYFAEGTGVLHTTTSKSSTAIAWISQSAGIEQLVSNWIISPPQGNPIVASWDRPVFTISDPDSYQKRYGINRINEIQHGASCDWASSSPNTIVCIANTAKADSSGYSKDGGLSWMTFATLPDEIGSGYFGGSIAASTSYNFVWVPSNCGNPYYTMNGGINWINVVIRGLPKNDCGWHRTYSLDRQIVIADRVNRKTFYMYNDGSATADAAGIWKSSDGGVSWSRVVSRAFDTGLASTYNAQMRAVPNAAGNFYFTSGWQSGNQPANQAFWECIDTETKVNCKGVANIKEVFSFGFGKSAPGSSYPTVFIYGWVNNILGIWRSDDHCVTWHGISDGFPIGSFDLVKVVEGDNNTYGKVYVGFGGSGYAYGKLR